MSTNLHIENLSYDYGSVQALSNVSFEALTGEVIAILGQNGAGKSTLLKIIGGALPLQSGDVVVDDIRLTQTPRVLFQNIGFVNDQLPLHEDATVDQYLSFCGRIRGLNGQALLDAKLRVLEAVNLEKKVQTRIAHLSKGYQQRVSIGQALIHNPSILIFDEPTAHLDDTQRSSFHRLVRFLAQDKLVLIATHFLADVAAMCARVIFLKNGSIRMDTSYEKLMAKQSEKQLAIRFGHPLSAQEFEEKTQIKAVSINHNHLKISVDDQYKAMSEITLVAKKHNWDLTDVSQAPYPLEAMMKEET